MSPQSHAQQLLTALYRQVLRRARKLRAAWALEPLPPRRLFAVTPVGGETLINAASTTGTQSTPDVAVSAGGVAAYVWEVAGATQIQPSVGIRADGQYLLAWAVSGDIHAQFHN